MSDFLSRFTAEDAPEAREVTLDGEKGTVYFRRLSAGQREKVLENMTIERLPGETSAVRLNLAENQRVQMLMVMYCVCDEHGKRRYLNLTDVEKIPADRLQALAEHASDVNSAEDTDSGKS